MSFRQRSRFVRGSIDILGISIGEESKYRARDDPSDFEDDNSIKRKIEKKAKRAEAKKKKRKKIT